MLTISPLTDNQCLRLVSTSKWNYKKPYSSTKKYLIVGIKSNGTYLPGNNKILEEKQFQRWLKFSSIKATQA